MGPRPLTGTSECKALASHYENNYLWVIMIKVKDQDDRRSSGSRNIRIFDHQDL